MNLNKFIILFLITSCTVTTNEEKILKKNEIIDKKGRYFQKSVTDISPIEDYEIDLTVSEKFNIDNDIKGINISHKLLPIPSVVKVSDPNNLSNYLIARNVKTNNNFRFSVSSEIVNKLNVKTNIFLEYLKDESINLRKVVDSKEESVIKMDSTIISTEILEDEQSGVSSKLDYSKIESLEAKIEKYKNIIQIDIYDELSSAKLQTNKIKNLGLFIEEIDDKIVVFAGPFTDNDINLKIDFLIKNGYLNAKTYP